MPIQKDQQTLVKIIRKHGGEWLEKTPVMSGNRAGVVNAGNGKIWVRFENGQEQKVLNTLAPLAFDRHILIGRLRSSPNVWRVAEIRENYLDSAGAHVQAHHEQHEYGGFDMVAVHRKQVMSATIFVSDATLFKVRVFGGLFPVPGGWAFAPSTAGTTLNPDIDLSSYIPDAGALYVNIETDSDGVYSVNPGDTVGSPELLTFLDVPAVPAGNRLIGFVMLYENMPQLLNEYIYLPGLFMTDYAVVDTGYQIDSAPEGVPTAPDKFGFWNVGDLYEDARLEYITWEDLLALIGAVVAPTTRWEPLANGDPSDPQLVFDGEGNVIMVEVEI